MKQVLIPAFVMVFTGGILQAQQAPQPPRTGTAQPAAAATQQVAPTQARPPAQSESHIAPGSIIPARLTKTVDARKVRKGDEIVAMVPGDLKSTSGQVIVPKATRIIGRITEAQARSKGEKQSQLGFAFDEMALKNGQRVQLPMSIQAIIAPPNRSPSSGAGGNEPTPGFPGSPAGNMPTAIGPGGAMGQNVPSPQGPPQPEESAPANPQTASSANPPITEHTQGVVGISNLTLSAAPESTTGSVVTSEKKNVKLEDGTMLLLRVSPAAAQSPQARQSPHR